MFFSFMKSTGRGRKLLYAPLPRPSRCAWKPLRTPLHTGSADKVWPGRGAARSAGFLTRAGQGMPPLPFSICGETMSKTTMGSTSVLQGGPGVTRKSAERQCRGSLELGGWALLAGRSPGQQLWPFIGTSPAYLGLLAKTKKLFW